MEKLSQIWFRIQGVLFPFLEKEIEEPLTNKRQDGSCSGLCQGGNSSHVWDIGINSGSTVPVSHIDPLLAG